MDEERVVEVVKRAIEWFDFDASDGPVGVPRNVHRMLEAESLSLARVVLANLQAKGFEVVERGVVPSYETCVIHLATRAVEEDPRVCWEYDGTTDCRFTSTHEATQ